ncbi:MAG: serine hydrolase domain-containing protein [Bacillota bacterium]|nr:serine hydrolase domain-containing protein [Bacillota bacterium]
MKPYIIPFFLCIFLISQTGCQNAAFLLHGKASASEELLYTVKKNKQVEKKLKNYLESQQISGSVMVVKNKGIVFNEGAGYSNIKKRKKNTPSTTYPIASMTKVFVATSILQLQEKGKLKITDPISKFIPSFPNGKKIKLYHLLTHTSGIRPPIWHMNDQKPQDLMKEIEKRGVAFQPGEKWDYIDANYMVLGFVIEKVSNDSLHHYIQKNIFNKAHMRSSGFMTSKHPTSYTSVGYFKGVTHLIPKKNFTIPLLFGCGDIYSTTYDLSLFDQALMSGKLINRKSLTEMLKHGPRSSYGLGLYHRGKTIFSRGVLGGWESFHIMYKDKINIVILLNIRNRKANIQKLSNDIHTIVAAEKTQPRSKKSR